MTIERGYCTRVRDILAAYNEGWLDQKGRSEIEAHLLQCESCMVEANRDRRLSLMLKELSLETTKVVAPAMPFGVKGYRVRPVRLASGFAAVCAIAFLAVHFHHIAPVATGNPRSVGTEQPEAGKPAAINEIQDANNIVMASDPTADPNRGVMLLLHSRQVGQVR